MSGYEEQLHARAEMLGETGELAAAVIAILAFASGAGVDPRAVVSLRAAAALDPGGGAPGSQAGSRADRHPGSGYRSDSEFLEAVSDAEDQIRDRLRDADQLAEQAIAAADKAHDDLEHAQRDLQAARAGLAAAYAMAARDPCTGCHPAKAAESSPRRRLSPTRVNASATLPGASACTRTPPGSSTRSPAGSGPPCRRSARCRTTSARSTSSCMSSSVRAASCPCMHGGSKGKARGRERGPGHLWNEPGDTRTHDR
jgi:hypothetical protein